MGEVKLKEIEDIKDGVVYCRFVPTEEYHRQPMSVTLGLNWDGVALPHPDIGDSHTLLAGTAYRFARKPPLLFPFSALL